MVLIQTEVSVTVALARNAITIAAIVMVVAAEAGMVVGEVVAAMVVEEDQAI